MLTFFRSRSNPQKIAAEKLYFALASQSRQPVFYADWGVPDSIDGRFDMVLLHAFLVMRKLAAGDEAAKGLSQALYDVMFVDMDRAVREMGIGDLSVKRHIRRMMTAFNGRMAAYEAGLNDPAALGEALRRNVYGTVNDTAATGALADYVRSTAAAIDAVPLQTVMDGTLIWPALGLKKSA